MYPVKFLTLLFNAKFLLIFFLGLILNSCTSYVLSKEEINQFYIDNISEETGMNIRNNLLLFFPNQNLNTTIYSIKVNIKINDQLYLVGSNGYASKGRVIVNVTWIIRENSTDKSKLSITSTYNESYNIEPSGFAIRNNREVALENLSARIASDIRQKIYGFVAREKKQAELLQMQAEAEQEVRLPGKICTDLECDQANP